MSFYVGMDVHRKRSQVAIVDAAGAPQRNRNLANDPAKLIPVLGALPPGTPVLPEAWIAPQQVRDLRALLRHRASLVRLSTSCKNRIHAVLADRGIPDHSNLWTGPGRACWPTSSCQRPHAGSSRTAVGCWTPRPPRSPDWTGRSPG